jgi:hypothetical protein
MILSKNSDVKGIIVKAIEGKPMYGGDLLVKPLIKGDEMTFLEIHYTPGVGAPLHVHSHESLVYVVKGKVKNDGWQGRIRSRSGRCLPPPKRRASRRRSNRGIDCRRDQIAGAGYFNIFGNVM